MAEFQEVVKQWTRFCKTIQRQNEAAGYPECGACDLVDICCGLNVVKITQIATVEETVMSWAAEHPEPVYPRWCDWLAEQGVLVCDNSFPNMRYWYAMNKEKMEQPIPADIAEKLGIEPKEGV